MDDQTSRPLYRQVADDLRGQIHRHELSPGGQLPTEAKLMDRYGVSRNTIRLALGLLRSEGLVITGQGRGSFVAEVPASVVQHGPRPQRHVIDRHSLDREIVEFDETADVDRVDVTVTTRIAPPAIADALRLPADARVLERRRVLFRDGQPSQTADSYVPEELADDGDLRRPVPLGDGIAPALERAGRPINGHVDEISVRMPSPVEAQELQIATGVPVVVLLRTSYDSTDMPVCATVALLPGDRHLLRYAVAVVVADGDGHAGEH
ncbi:MAG TPA: GntR family transcriptional regulator [Euzebyales bacterium]|nr:GntR family transcriptional regulator [Euzebyales bacterium]